MHNSILTFKEFTSKYGYDFDGALMYVTSSKITKIDCVYQGMIILSANVVSKNENNINVIRFVVYDFEFESITTYSFCDEDIYFISHREYE